MPVDQEEVVMNKGKRSKRARPASPLALTMATSSSTTAEISGGVGFGGGGVISGVTGSSDIRVTTSGSDSGEFTQRTDEEEEDMANCLILLANGQSQKSSQLPVAVAASKAAVAVALELYQCKTCNKSFSSFQALGGHRASHKKPNKPITAEERKASVRDIHKQDNILSNHTILSLQLSNRVLDGTITPQNKSRIHECSMCGAEFASGQALGGHMRRHRPIPTASTNSHGAESQEAAKKQKNLLSLDLNLPAPEDHDHHRESKFPFTPKEQVIVFSTSPLIDCQY